ncbi:MAG: type II toxin-antitoxin system RelE/ParE family toxin [Angustibacter sp.]
MRWVVEFSDEVLGWYRGLTPEGKAAARRVFSRLEESGHLLGMPLSKQLGGGLRELRFTCEGVARRVTYTSDPKRKAVTLTTFRKQRQNERAQILRARRAQAAREAERQATQEARATNKKGSIR